MLSRHTQASRTLWTHLSRSYVGSSIPLHSRMARSASDYPLRGSVASSSSFMISHNAPVMYTQSRGMVLKDFVESFKKNLKENIKKEPEFGGQIKRLQETSENVKEVAKSTKTTGSTFGKKIADSVKEKVSSTVDVASKAAKERTEKLKGAATPYVEDVLKETKKIADIDQVKETTEAVNKVLEETSKVLGDTAEKTSKVYKKTAETTGKVLDPVTKTVKETVSNVSETVTDSKIAKDYKALKSAVNQKSTFNPTPEKMKTQSRKNFSTALTVTSESKWSKWKESLSSKWQELGDSNSRLSYLVEAVDSWSERWKRISSSPMGIMVSNLKKEYPDFEVDAFQDWVTTVLVPRVLTGKKYDDFVKEHSGDLIKQLYKTKQLPLPWKFVNISHTEIFPAQDQDTNYYRFFFKIQGQVKEIDSKTKLEKIYNVILILSTKLNDEKVWVLTEFQEIEKAETLF